MAILGAHILRDGVKVEALDRVRETQGAWITLIKSESKTSQQRGQSRQSASWRPLFKVFALHLAFVVEHLMRQLMSPEDTEMSAASAQSGHLKQTTLQPRYPCQALKCGRTFPLILTLESSHEEPVMLLWVVIHFQQKVKTQSGQDLLKSQLKIEVEKG